MLVAVQWIIIGISTGERIEIHDSFEYAIKHANRLHYSENQCQDHLLTFF